jgi:hypothetical protein
VGAILARVKVVVLGGTRFIGPYVVRLLAERGHKLTIIHRGETETELPDGVRHIHVPFARLSEAIEDVRASSADVILDMVPYLDKGGHGVLQFSGIADRAVVITSCDVYRAFGRLWRSEPGPPEPVPLTEDSPLRSRAAADTGAEEVAYDNIDVERAVPIDERLPVTILRLPATHEPGDPQHRLFRHLKRMDDRRPFIVLEESHAAWHWVHGYVRTLRTRSPWQSKAKTPRAASTTLPSKPRMPKRTGFGGSATRLGGRERSLRFPNGLFRSACVSRTTSASSTSSTRHALGVNSVTANR